MTPSLRTALALTFASLALAGAPARAAAPAAASSSAPAARPAIGAADDAVVEARRAFARGNAARIAALAPAAAGSVLASYFEYWQLALAVRAGNADEATVRAFWDRHAGEVVSDRLRLDWLLALGARGDFPHLVAERRLLQYGQDDPQLLCYESLARYSLVPEEARPPLAVDARRLLAATVDPGSEACTALATRLLDDGRLAPWPRLQALVERNQVSAALKLVPRLPTPQGLALRRMLERPTAWLGANLSRITPETRPVALLAMVAVAREKPEEAAVYAGRIDALLDEGERAMLWGRIAHMGQQSLRPEAGEWFDKAGDSIGKPVDYVRPQEVLESRVRVRLGQAAAGGCPDGPVPAGEAQSRWSALLASIDALDPSQRTDVAWVYWSGCALSALGRGAEAQARWASIAERFGYYGRLAADALGRPLLLPPSPDAATQAEVDRIADRPGFARARKFLELSLREEGNREWSHELRDLDDRGLIAAAELARRMALPDRMIASSERTHALFDAGQRYPMPHRERLEAIASPLGLDPSWVYGLIRQESRFIEGVRSSAGAVGLMQVMPTTARFVARRLGMGGVSGERIADVDVNLRLGTEYLKLVLDDQDGHPVLASAAYNAGPRRVRRWRAGLERETDGATFVETIPIPETRDYVRKVLFNTIVYRALLDEPPMTLRALLARVQPREASDNDLP